MGKVPITIFDREREFAKEGFYVSDKVKKILMCRYCNMRIDWSRRDTCVKHCSNSSVHKKKKEEAGNARQVTIEASYASGSQSTREKKEFINATCKAFLQSNIPLQKLDSPPLRKWMNTYMKGAGDLPNADTMRSSYVPTVREQEEAAIKNVVRGKFVGIMCDETTDRKGQCVFMVLIKVLECKDETNMYVGGVKILQSADHKECSRAILEVLNKYEIAYDNVVFMASDSARYMGKCFRSLKDGFLRDELIHIECWAHKLNLVGNIWQIELPELNECVTHIKNAFNNARKRKNHYIFHLKNNHPHMAAKQFPLPVMTRWNSWHLSVQYVCEYLSPMVEFFKSEDGGASIQYFKGLQVDEMAVVQCQAAFVVEHCQSTIDMIVVLEGSSYPYAHKLHGKLTDLQRSLAIVSEGNFNFQTAGMLQEVQPKHRPALTQKLKNVAVKSSTKLSSLLTLDPAKVFLSSMAKLFDPRNMVTVTNDEVKLYAKHIPFLASLANNVLLEGYCALKSKVCGDVSAGKEVAVLATLLSLKADHGEFVESAVKAMWVPVSNVDSERGFSAYNNVLTDKRTALKPENVELMVALTFGDNLL